MKNAATLFAALSDPVRLSILRELCNGGGCVSAIQLATGKSQPNVSQHLRVLRGMGLVEHRRDGRRICYSVKDRQVRSLVAAAEKWEGENGK